MKIKAAEIAKICQGEILCGDPEKIVKGVAIDSRLVKKDDLFVPFRGVHTDGHLHIAKAYKGGAAGSLYASDESPDFQVAKGFFLLRVNDSLQALQRLATAYREYFDLPVIGITGSSGKTTTKDFLAGVLSVKYNVLKTTGNLNNEIGLPLTIMKLAKDHQVAVLEMGMTATGEIRDLCHIAKPEIGIITNIGMAHVEQLGSLDAIAKAKTELLDYLGSGGIAVLNSDDSRLLKIGKRFPGKVYYYGFNQGDIECLELSQRGEKSFFRVRFPNKSEGWFEAPLPGREMIGNTLAALTVGYIFQLTIPEMQKGLVGSDLTEGRLQLKKGQSGVRIIDDSYNANPDSFQAAIKVLISLAQGKKGAVIGDMLELGNEAQISHLTLGEVLGDAALDFLITIGDLASLTAKRAEAKGIKVYSCQSHEEATGILSSLNLSDEWSVLVKGSRGMKMDIIVHNLINMEGAV